MARRQLLIKAVTDIQRVTNDKVDNQNFKELLQKFDTGEAKANIDAYLDGQSKTLKQPSKFVQQVPQKPKTPEKMIGRHVITLWDGKVYKPYAMIIEEYKGHYIV